MKKRHKLFESFNCATEGLLYVFKTQKNMKIHFFMAAFILLFCIFFLQVSKTDIIFLFITITFVLLAEMLNTAVELTLDMISEAYHPLARIIKDICAGAVLIASINAVVVGFLLLTKYLDKKIVISIHWILDTPWYFTFICIFLVLIIAVGLKIFLHKGTPFHGGMPSAHAAIAFSCWTLISLYTKVPVVVGLGFIIAFMVAQSRIANGVHSFQEVFLGALLGALFTVFFYQLAVFF